MKKILIGFCLSAFLAFFIGCTIDRSLGVNDQEVQPAGNSVARFSINFNDSGSLAKVSTVGDSLTIIERKALFNYLKHRPSGVQVTLVKIGGKNDQPDGASDYIFRFPIVNGICDSSVGIDSGDYRVDCYDYGKIKAGPDSFYSCNFQLLHRPTQISVGKKDTTTIGLSLVRLAYFSAVIYLSTDKGKVLNGILDSVFSVGNQGVIIGGSFRPVVTNGYVEALNINPAKGSFTFFLNGKKYSGIFDVTKIIDDNVIEVVVSEVAQAFVNVSVSFADEAPFAIDDKYPKPGDTVTYDYQTVSITFNHRLADFSEMSNFVFSVEEVPANVVIDIGTIGTPKSSNMEWISGRTMMFAFNFKPNSRYICRISKAVDEYGKILQEGAVWMFYTNDKKNY